MIRIDKEKAIALHEKMARETGGGVGVRDEALLESALNGAFATFDGVDLYPSVEEKAARIGFSLIADHAFFDGNKRIGIFIMLIVLEVNGVRTEASDEEVIALAMSVAAGKSDYPAVLSWVRAHRKTDLSL